MEPDITYGPDKIIVKPTSDITMTTLQPLKKSLLEIGEQGLMDVEVDFVNVEYIDSSGLGVLLILMKMLKKHNRSLSIINCSEKILGILKLSSLNDIL